MKGRKKALKKEGEEKSSEMRKEIEKVSITKSSSKCEMMKKNQ